MTILGKDFCKQLDHNDYKRAFPEKMYQMQGWEIALANFWGLNRCFIP